MRYALSHKVNEWLDKDSSNTEQHQLKVHFDFRKAKGNKRDNELSVHALRQQSQNVEDGKRIQRI